MRSASLIPTAVTQLSTRPAATPAGARSAVSAILRVSFPARRTMSDSASECPVKDLSRFHFVRCSPMIASANLPAVQAPLHNDEAHANSMLAAL
eukprot:3475519-Pleurochrysis_carterae.AAC.1